MLLAVFRAVEVTNIGVFNTAGAAGADSHLVAATLFRLVWSRYRVVRLFRFFRSEA